MLIARTAYTYEMYDIELAVEEIQEGLRLRDMPISDGENCAAIVMCDQEFIDTGVVAALHEALNIPLFGATSVGSGVAAARGEGQMSVLLLSGRDVRFANALSEEIPEEIGTLSQTARELYLRAVGDEHPAIVFFVNPLPLRPDGDSIAPVFTEVSGGAPAFGLGSVNYEKQEICQGSVIHNGESHHRKIAALFVYGDVHPHFLVKPARSKLIKDWNAVVTGVDGNILKTINNMPAAEYLKSVGYAPDGDFSLSYAFPLLVDFGDGAPPLPRSVFHPTEDGSIVLGGSVTVGSIISLATLSKESILEDVKNIGEQAGGKGYGVAILASCVSRLLPLGLDNTAEMDAFAANVAADIEWLFYYAGGEFCPDNVPAGQAHTTRFYNNSLICCLL